MPDISMCSNTKCEKRYECYRYRAIPSYWQSSSPFSRCVAPEYVMMIESNKYPEKMLVPIEEIKKKEKE